MKHNVRSLLIYFSAHALLVNSITSATTPPTIAPSSTPITQIFTKPYCWDTYVVDEGSRLHDEGERGGVFTGEPIVFNGFPLDGNCSNQSNIFGGGLPDSIHYEVHSTSITAPITYCSDSNSGRTSFTVKNPGVYTFQFVVSE
jgi:hypothetical protein